MRAKQFQRCDHDRTQVIPLLLHGDAAFAGQGVVAECLDFSGLRGYRTGGTIHIIVNNQIGFTTSPRFSRSSPYPSDVARMVGAPIFHVNGDDPDAVCYVALLATAFRQKFKKDVVIDLFCYRRFGHNENDEPKFTQPIMYKKIEQHPSTCMIYSEKLRQSGVVSAEEIEQYNKNTMERLEEAFAICNNYKPDKADWLKGLWAGIESDKGSTYYENTGVSIQRLQEIGRALTTIPQGLNLHPTLQRIIKTREKNLKDGQNIDWSLAEALAFGSLLVENIHVRLSGQDSGRGTFSQRHCVWVDQETEEHYLPLQNLVPDQAVFEVHDSSLSEVAVLGFEYGYSNVDPKCLVLWEAQYGDFANGAQVVVDQFISAAESKWLRVSGLVMLLPHGYEGQGPEHSSARLERYLQLCAEDNMQVANCTTPANYFHILRRQIKRKFRKPLILMTPKGLLRHPKAVSTLQELSEEGEFHHMLNDLADNSKNNIKAGEFKLVEDDKIKRVILCSGRVYYDLLALREKQGSDDIYIARIEQLYPFPAKLLANYLSRFKYATSVVWCQEEPRNMGAWRAVEPWLEWAINKSDSRVSRPIYAGRAPAAAPAVGLIKKHEAEQNSLITEALKLN